MNGKEKTKFNSFTDYLLDKVESCYYDECKNAVAEFKSELTGGRMSAKEKEETKKFCNYIIDKIEDCYKDECKNAVADFFKDLQKMRNRSSER